MTQILKSCTETRLQWLQYSEGNLFQHRTRYQANFATKCVYVLVNKNVKIGSDSKVCLWNTHSWEIT